MQPDQGPSTASEPQPLPFRAQLGSILFLTSIFYVNFVGRIIISPLSPIVENDLRVGHGETGSIFLVISVGYFVGLFGSGFVSSRITHKGTVSASAMGVGLCLLAASLIPGLSGIRIAMFFVGLAAGTYLPSGITAITASVDSRQWGKAISVHELAPSLAFLSAPLICEALLIVFSWREVLAVVGTFSLFAGIAFGRFARYGRFHGQAPGFAALRILIKEPGFWIMMGFFALGIGASLGVYTMLPLYLVSEKGLDRTWANTLLSFSRIAPMATVFLGGWATDRFGPKATIMTGFLFTGAMTVLMGLASHPAIQWIVLVQPSLAACFFPAGFAALSFMVPPETRSVAVSLTVPAGFLLGAGAVPTAIGVMGDAGCFGLSISLFGTILLLGGVAAIFLRFSGK